MSNVSEKSSETEIMEWLKTVIGLTEVELSKFPGFRFLDGDSLFTYEDVRSFHTDLNIPIGLARKILYFRNNKCIEALNGNIVKWNVEDVRNFIREETFSEKSPEVDEICKLIIERYIDGSVMLSYKDHRELQNDLQNGENTLGIIYKRIFDRFNREAEKTTTASNSNVPLYTQPTGQEADNISITQRKEETVQLDTKLKTLGADWISFLSEKLHLYPTAKISVGESPTIKSCNLNFFHCDWKNRNILERRLIFFVLSNECDFDNERAKKSVWDLIRKNMTIWQTHFSKRSKDEFTTSQTDDTLFYNKQPFALSKSPLKMRFLMEKQLSEISDIENTFLLIAKSVRQKDVHSYTSLIEKPYGKKGDFIKYSFSFNPKHKYWLFDQQNFSYGFQLRNLPVNVCGQIHDDYRKQCHEEIPIKDTENSYISRVSTSTERFGIDQYYSLPEKNLESELFCRELPDEFGKTSKEKIPITDIEESLLSHVSTSTVHSDIELPYSLPENKLERDEIDIEHFPSETQINRSFKQDATDIQYIEGLTILPVEHDGSASYQCFEFKLVPDILIQKGTERTTSFILKETIRFACGCLNARKNGTIMYGIGDSIGQSSSYKHGEVVGIEIDKIPGDFREILASSLIDAIEKCFEGHNCLAAAKCIGAPHFVPIACKKNIQKKFVIEIDIEPAHIFCKAEIFKINRRLIGCAGNDVENSFELYVREGQGTKKKVKADLKLFLREMPDIIQKRIDDEKQMILLHPSQSVVSPMDKLRKFLCKGSNKFDKSIWPILVLGKPSSGQKENKQWVSSLKFIKYFHFHAVFDFDNDSNRDGLCSAYRNPKTSIIQDEEIFEDFSGKKLDLATRLGMPHDMKTVWIFCNGRTDTDPIKLYANKSNWSKAYSAGIRDAVIFFSQNEIIPKGRAVVIVLLFSNDFNGLIETFREITVRFGWEQIAIIATDSILSRFETEYVDDKQNIQNCAIAGKGVTWEHINSTFLEITGDEDQYKVFLTTSSGANVPADEKFLESLNEFHIVSAKQCEIREFKSRDDKVDFASRKEENFYRGERVDWYNFHFDTHVLKRHCFDRLKNTIDNILKFNSNGNDRENKIESTVIIAHEPGAGGSTLSRHMLWEFHKKNRCAIILKITDRTAKNILSLWQHKEADDAKPLLLLIDELLPSDFTLEGLIRQLHIEYRANQTLNSFICCFLVCHRENEINNDYLGKSLIVNRHGHNVEHLMQKLTDVEVNWMDRKYEQLEKNKRLEYKPEYLLPYMIMREGYNQEYIQKTIEGFLSKINMKSNEFELLEYASLLSAYVPIAKRAPNVYIPLECCDRLMGSRVMNTVYWEKNMSYILKIFLIIEQKETASGMQIRMASHMLAKAVLHQILSNKKESLSSLTKRYLECSIFQSQSYGAEMILNFTNTMLLRRLKEEYNDDQTTSFSPLIEAICKKEHWTDAVMVLNILFDKTKDSYVAHSLARLCSKSEDFENAVQWSQTAVTMSSDIKREFFSQQVYAGVLEGKFIYDKKHINSVIPTEAVKYIEIILSALDHFIAACELSKGVTDILYPIMGVLQSIVNCLEFMRVKVILSSNVKLRNYFIDQNYLPDELVIWNSFRPKLLNFENEGEKAFAVMEQSLCFQTTFYSHDTMSPYPRKKSEHRLYKAGQRRYESFFKQFRLFFGEEKKIMPKEKNPELLNKWRRRRLIWLGGNSYMNICNILQKVRSTQFSSADAIAMCNEIKYHLSNISDRTAKDLANLVSVNIVLGLLGGDKRDETKEIMGCCQQINKMRRGYESYANFFISMLLWPSVEIDIEYDDDLFYESLKKLVRKKAAKQGRQKDSRNMFLKEEENITQPTSQFFLKNGRGFDCFCFRADIFVKERNEAEFEPDMWEENVYKHNLKRLTGVLKFENNPVIIFKNENSTRKSDIEIRKLRTGRIDEYMNGKTVTFVLGFSIEGPIAYNVKLDRYTDPDVNPVLSHSYMQEQETVESIERKLSRIHILKTKFEDGYNLTEEEVSW